MPSQALSLLRYKANDLACDLGAQLVSVPSLGVLGIFAGQVQARCDLGAYHDNVRDRQEREAQHLANLTGWDIADIRTKIDFAGGELPQPEKEPWWKRLWK